MTDDRTRVVPIIAARRTGSNYFCGLIDRAFVDVHASYEIFHADKSYIYSKAKPQKTIEVMGHFSIAPDDPDREKKLVEIAHSNPSEYVRVLSAYCEQQVLAFKIFQSHLKRRQVAEVIDCADLVIFLKREFVDVYISMKKSQLMDQIKGSQVKRTNLDTSNVKIVFDPEEYEQKKANYDNWYASVQSIVSARGTPSATFVYEDLHGMTRSAQQVLLQDAFADYLGLRLPVEKFPIEDHRRQDTSSSYEEKVENYDLFASYLGVNQAGSEKTHWWKFWR